MIISALAAAIATAPAPSPPTLPPDLPPPASDVHGGPPGVLYGARILEVVADTPGSGIVAWWHQWTVRTQGGVRMELFSISLAGKGDPLPPVGQVCDIRYRMETSDGVVGDGAGGFRTAAAPRPTVDSFACPSGTRFVATER